MWFEVKIKRFDEVQEKDIPEAYLFEAVNWTEAETRTFEKMEEYSYNAFKIQSIKKSNIVEVEFYDSGEYWMKGIIELIVSDDNGQDKKAKEHVLLMADDIQQAISRINEEMIHQDAASVIYQVGFSNIVEVFTYNKEK